MTTDRMPVWRTQKFANLTLSGVTGEGRFSGYASVFGEVDLGKDAIAPGAFQQSLIRRWASGVRMLFQHDPGEALRSPHEYRYHRHNEYSRPIYRAVGHGAHS